MQNLAVVELIVSERIDLLPEDKATYARWRRGLIILYLCIGFVAVAGISAVQWLQVADQLAGN